MQMIQWVAGRFTFMMVVKFIGLALLFYVIPFHLNQLSAPLTDLSDWIFKLFRDAVDQDPNSNLATITSVLDTAKGGGLIVKETLVYAVALFLTLFIVWPIMSFFKRVAGQE